MQADLGVNVMLHMPLSGSRGAAECDNRTLPSIAHEHVQGPCPDMSGLITGNVL